MWLVATMTNSMGIDSVVKVMTEESNDSGYSVGQHINSCHPASQSNFVPGKKMAVGFWGREIQLKESYYLGFKPS